MGNAIDNQFLNRGFNVDDLNSTGIQFVGGRGYKQFDDYEHAPMDKLCQVFAGKDDKGNDREPVDVYRISHKDLKSLNEESASYLFGLIITSLHFRKKMLEKVNPDKRNTEKKIIIDPLSTMTGQKYSISDAEMQTDLTMKMLWKLSGFVIPKEEQDHCCQSKGLFALGNLINSGYSGDHKIHAEAVAKCDTSEFKQYKGWANIPLACLRMYLEFPYVADQAKYDLLKWEFVRGKKKRYDDDRYMGAFNGVAGELVRIGQDKEAP